jgi:hypothetical protein
MARLKQVYRITYPNGKWRVGMDVTGAISNFGSPSNKVLMAAESASFLGTRSWLDAIDSELQLLAAERCIS